MGTFLSAVVRIVMGLVFGAVGVFMFAQIGWPYLTAYLRPEGTVTVGGPCRPGVNESEQVCAASWTTDPPIDSDRSASRRGPIGGSAAADR